MGVGIDFVGRIEEAPRRMRSWESRFSSDPLVFEISHSQPNLAEFVDFPFESCEIKLYRDYAGLLEGVPFDILPAQRGCRLLILGLPVAYSLSTMISKRLDDIRFISILKRSNASDAHDFDRSVMLVFKNQSGADRFFREWHLQFFDPDSTVGPVCYILFIDKLFIDQTVTPSFRTLLPFGSQQIPACPFCVERIDVNVSGLVTSRRGWLSSGRVSSSSCVACSNLCSNTLSCAECEGTGSGLWLCLLCGNIGCGRYEKAHAEMHSKSSNHRLSLEISTGRIWDYKDDLFVHRRIVSQPSAPILDLPERIDHSSLPAHPQVSFEEDIRELDETMARQLAYERSKYEEACTQLKALGKSRVHEEEVLLIKEQAEEEALGKSLADSKVETERLRSKIRETRERLRAKEADLAKKKRHYSELLNKFQNLSSKAKEPVSVPKSRLEELKRLETEAEGLRSRVSAL